MISHLFGPRSSRRGSGRAVGRIIMLVVALVIGGAALYLATITGLVVTHLSDPVQPEVLPDARPAVVQVGQRINILAMGLDDDGFRTDTMMLISVDPQSKRVGVLGIPRDTRTLLSGRGTVEKINGAYAYGVGDKQFPANLRALKTLEGLLDIQIHYTVIVDLEGFRRAIDEIGGVSIDIPFAMEYDDPEQDLHIYFQPGVQQLDGKQALNFVRWRNNNDGTGYPDGDLGRIRTQQQFLASLIDEMLKPTNLLSLTGQATSLARYVETTMEPSRIASLAVLAGSIRKENVEFATLPGTTAYLPDPHYEDRLSYFLHDPVRTQQLVDRLVRGIDPKAASQVQVAVVTAGSVENAEQIRERLTDQGFAVGSVSRTGVSPDRTRVVNLRGDGEKSMLVGKALMAQGHTVEIVTAPESEAEADVRIIVGRE